MLGVVIKPVLSLFDKYFQDAMLSDDILQLIQTLGNVPDNTVFKQAVLPEVQAVIQRLHCFACEQQNAQEVQKMIESGMAKAVLDIFRDYCTQVCEKSSTLTAED